MKGLPYDPEVLLAMVGLCLVCVFVGNLVRILLAQQMYIGAAGILGMVIGVGVYFDSLRRRPSR